MGVNINVPSQYITQTLKSVWDKFLPILSNPPSQVTPELQSGYKIQNAILELAYILKRAEDIPSLPEIQSK